MELIQNDNVWIENGKKLLVSNFLQTDKDVKISKIDIFIIKTNSVYNHQFFSNITINYNIKKDLIGIENVKENLKNKNKKSIKVTFRNILLPDVYQYFNNLNEHFFKTGSIQRNMLKKNNILSQLCKKE